MRLVRDVIEVSDSLNGIVWHENLLEFGGVRTLASFDVDSDNDVDLSDAGRFSTGDAVYSNKAPAFDFLILSQHSVSLMQRRGDPYSRFAWAEHSDVQNNDFEKSSEIAFEFRQSY